MSNQPDIALSASLELERRRRKHARSSKKSLFVDRYYTRPDLFVQELFDWGIGDHSPTEYQLEILNSLVTNQRLAVRGPHGLGKTTLAAWTVLWFALTRDMAEIDWKIPTTASAWRQLQKFLWPEIRKWSRRLVWEEIPREPFNTKEEFTTLALKLDYGEALALASSDPGLIEGAHADELLYVFDEAKIIPDATWDAAEGAFSTGKCYWLAISTPGDPNGRFYDIHAKKAGTTDWAAIHVTVDRAIAAGRLNADWVEKRKTQWGETSAVFLNRVKGEFATGEADGLIPLSWVELAIERWWEKFPTFDANGSKNVLTQMGVDVARSGGDSSVIAKRYGTFIPKLEKFAFDDSTETTGLIGARMRAERTGEVWIDVVGFGAGIYDSLKQQSEHEDRVREFNGTRATEWTDYTQIWRFRNVRAASWWNLKDLLDPAREPELCLPPDDELIGELTSVRYKILSDSVIQLEAKEALRDRLHRSPDSSDAVVMACWGISEDSSLLLFNDRGD